MKLEDQVCSLDLAKRLKDLGCPQESLFWWIDMGEIDKRSPYYKPYFRLESDSTAKSRVYNNRNDEVKEEQYSAYTVAELGEMLPYYLVNRGELTIKKNYRRDCLTGWNCCYEKTINCDGSKLPVICDDKQANCLARMLIYLYENGLIKEKSNK